ncbi:hypothetical protein LguiB_029081 [Lonicera macranthoides]
MLDYKLILSPSANIITKASILFLGKDKPISRPPSDSLDPLSDIDPVSNPTSNFLGFPHPKSISCRLNFGDPLIPNILSPFISSSFEIHFSASFKTPPSLFAMLLMASAINLAPVRNPSSPSNRRLLVDAIHTAKQLPKYVLGTGGSKRAREFTANAKCSVSSSCIWSPHAARDLAKQLHT